jgi:HK97 family phage portal protein
MANTKHGDVRIKNELSKQIDIRPNLYMTRSEWMEGIVMTLMLYGKGNAVVVPHTWDGILRSLVPISAHRVSFLPVGTSYRDYKVMIDGRARDPESVLHFTYNPDKNYLWMGRGVDVSLRDLANNLKQASKTERGFMESKWKPSIIVKVDAMIDEFSTPEGRQKILDDYVKAAEVGQPWLIPGEQFQVEQVKPLSLADLAIKDTVELDRRMVASIFGLPPFVLGVGEYNQNAWNNFIQTKVRPLALKIAQEMTNKLIIKDEWYLKFNERSLFDWDVVTVSQMLSGLYDRGIVTGNEVRDRVGYDPKEGLDDLKVLENYINIDRIDDQKKLKQNGE